MWQHNIDYDVCNGLFSCSKSIASNVGWEIVFTANITHNFKYKCNELGNDKHVNFTCGH